MWATRSAGCPVGGRGSAGRIAEANCSMATCLSAYASGSTAAIGSHGFVSGSTNARGMCSPTAVLRAAITGWHGSIGTWLARPTDSGLPGSSSPSSPGVQPMDSNRGDSCWSTTVAPGRCCSADSVSAWNDGGSGTARQSKVCSSITRRTATAKSPLPWITGSTSVFSLIARGPAVMVRVRLRPSPRPRGRRRDAGGRRR